MRATLRDVRRTSTTSPTSLWIGCGLALAGIVLTALSQRSQERTIRQQQLLLDQAQKLLSSKSPLEFQSLVAASEPPQPDLGLLDEVPEPLTAEQEAARGLDPISADILADAGFLPRF